MNSICISCIPFGIKFYLLFIAPISFVIILSLLALLRKLVNQQVDQQVDKFAKDAKIPTIFRNKI